MMRVLACTLSVLATTTGGLILAQEQRPISRDCRQQVIGLCGTDRAAIRQCLRDKAGQFSEACRTQLRARAGVPADARQGANGGGAATVRPRNEIAYGEDPLQRLDFYRAAGARTAAPLMLFVHGGGWKRGDKGNATGAFKADHYTALGFHFASMNYRLVPAATVEQQATDIAQALAVLIGRADALGIDRRKIVLMGHSAGAHLVALVATDPRYLRAAGLSESDIAGVIPLDGAGYDVAAQMADTSALLSDTYRQAFGTDPARQKLLSPTLNAGAPDAANWLVLHVARPDSKSQSEALGAAVRKAGASATVREVAGSGLAGHMEINRRLGDPTYAATSVVDDWLKQLLG